MSTEKNTEKRTEKSVGRDTWETWVNCPDFMTAQSPLFLRVLSASVVIPFFDLELTHAA